MIQNSFFSTEQFRHAFDVVSIENALIDLLVRANDSDLKTFGMNKGVMQLVDEATQKNVLQNLGSVKPEVELGGSASNALRGMAILGAKTSYSSTVGDDAYGRAFAKRLDELSIENRLSIVDGVHTGTCLVVVTPDGERTLNTNLGACLLYKPSYVPFDDIAKSKIFFSTGYMLDSQNQIDALSAAIDHALLNDVKVAFDVADPFVIKRHGRARIMSLLEKTHLVFLNAEEANILLEKSPEAAALELAKFIQISVVKDGEKGAYIAYDGKVIFIPAKKVEVADTTGAGDMFAGGFMFGLCRGLNLEQSGQIATLLAADTVSYMGVRLSSNIREQIAAIMK
ncbi:adenosine kinase [Spirobacillus cienkowskii]|jgi:sugar/nucleoside kinase (ribokinase family)|uniref:Adenosine kinase n=1 Tax=Spirobacillus cienkowskii TaxID=495820 RepID=A0A369KRN8_9BACT|nr:MAG: adenosine kinase [Spirobacillus cienkowskii]